MHLSTPPDPVGVTPCSRQGLALPNLERESAPELYSETALLNFLTGEIND